MMATGRPPRTLGSPWPREGIMAQSISERPKSVRATIAIACLLIAMVVGLVGGIIWYNFDKTAALSVIAGQKLIAESSSDTAHRIELFYEPVLAIVALASRVPRIADADVNNDSDRLSLVITGLKRYPQLFSLYVAYDNGDFDLVTRIGGKDRAVERDTLGAPETAAFAHEVISTGSDGVRRTRWSFLDDNGAVIQQRDPVEANYDPRVRQWFRLALGNDDVHRSDPYIFAASQEIGITLSRRLKGSTTGVFGADLAMRDVAGFLKEKKITRSSEVFIFNAKGEIVAYPDESKIDRTVTNSQESTLVPTTIASLKEPVLTALYKGAKKLGNERMIPLEVEGRAYISEVLPIMQQFGGSDFLGVVVPVKEITGPIDAIRTQALIYSIAVLALALPLFGTMVFVWLDRRLGRSASLSDIKGLTADDLE